MAAGTAAVQQQQQQQQAQAQAQQLPIAPLGSELPALLGMAPLAAGGSSTLSPQLMLSPLGQQGPLAQHLLPPPLGVPGLMGMQSLPGSNLAAAAGGVQRQQLQLQRQPQPAAEQYFSMHSAPAYLQGGGGEQAQASIPTESEQVPSSPATRRRSRASQESQCEQLYEQPVLDARLPSWGRSCGP